MNEKDKTSPNKNKKDNRSVENVPGDDSVSLARLLAEAIDEKKGDRIEVLDLRGITIWADFFVIASGAVRIQIQAMAEEAILRGRKHGRRHRAVEGLEDSDWILIDFSDVVVHLMTQESREFYRLEKLWGDAPKVNWKNDTNETEKE